MTAPTKADQKLQWNDRMKALELMVPAENEEAARSLVSSIFSPKKKNGFKTFSDCYLFVGPERENNTERRAPIFSAMVARHKFRMAHIGILFVTIEVLVKSIDISLSTRKPNVFLTIREMILNYPSNAQQLGGKEKSKLFLSVDYTPDSSKVWWNKQPGTGGAGYILSFYQWDEGEANEVRKGLGAYLGHHYGKSGLYSSFNAAHWEAVADWEWNETEQRFLTPEEKHLAASILNDPTADVMNAYHQKQHLLETLEKANEKKLAKKSKSSRQTGQDTNETTTKPDQNKSREVQVLEKFEKIAVDTDAQSCQLSYSEFKSMDDASKAAAKAIGTEEDDRSTFSQLRLIRAREIQESENDPEVSSIPQLDGKNCFIKNSNLNQVDAVSVTSEMTDITNNTTNREYFEDDASDRTAGSTNTIATIKSLKSHDIRAMKTQGLNRSEI